MKLSLEQRIAAAEQKKLKAENEIKTLKAEFDEREKKAKNERIFKRGEYIEKMLPEIITLTQKQFIKYAERVMLTGYARREMQKIIAEDAQPAAKSTQTAQGGVTIGNGNTPNNTQQTS